MSQSNTSKRCSVCERSKPLGDFYRHPRSRDGRAGLCKSCQKARARARYARKSQDPEWRESERVRAREKFHRLYSGKPKAPRSKKRDARVAVGNAVRDRRIAPAPNCETCGHDFSEFRREAHHTDYDEPLRVIWLCSRCHRRRHQRSA